ncbi:hypothetical protein [Rickettsia endosymbiont of Pantilius tunicatus]|uniref:hypothetical protein n=1 Tax=Rickettsia endosymbiont of Pantilius tunicatus TaxID=3066267 RepID=UPI0030E08EBC
MFKNIFKRKNNTYAHTTGEYWYKLAENYYHDRQKLIDNNESQTKIDSAGVLAAKDFWVALCLGYEKAPFSLYACFGQGIGVKQDNDIASFMFALAQELKDVRVANKECMFSLPISFKDKVHETAALMKQVKIPKSGIDMQHVNKQMDDFSKVMILPDGREIFKLITDGSNTSDSNTEILGEQINHSDF